MVLFSQTIIISEVLFNPCCGGGGSGNAQTFREWIELQNVSLTDTIDLKGWYLRTDLNNSIASPTWGDSEIESWESRNPGTIPNISSGNESTIKTNVTKILPGQFALIFDPSWNTSTKYLNALPDSCIILTVKTFKNIGADGQSPPNNGLLNNPEDLIYLYNGNPNDTLSQLIDSISWKNNLQKNGFSLQLDDDCIYRWDNNAVFSSSGGYEADTNKTILGKITPGTPNYKKTSPIIDGPDTICIGESATFSVNLIYTCLPNSLNWNFGDANSGTNNIAQQVTITKHLYLNKGKKLVSLVLKVGELTDTIFKVIYVIMPSPINLGNDTLICLGDSLILNAGTTFTSYVWSTGDTNSIIVADSTANYFVWVTDKNGCKNNDSIRVDILPLPIVSFAFNNVCENDTVYFSNLSSNGNYHWDWGDQSSSTAKETYHVYNNASLYTINLITTDQFGCIDSLSQNITVYPLPSISIDADTLMGCQPLSVNFSTTSLNADSFYWSFGDGITSKDTTPSHLFSQSGEYDISLTATSKYGCITNLVAPQFINVFSLPTAAFTTSPDYPDQLSSLIQFSNTASNDVVAWQWFFGDGESDGDENPLHMYRDTGTFNLTQIVINTNGCSDTSYQQIHVDPVYTFYVPNSFTPNGDGYNDYFIPKGIKIDTPTFYMDIYDRWGQLIFSTNDFFKGWDGKINNNIAPLGVYVWKINFKEESGKRHSYKGDVTLLR